MTSNAGTLTHRVARAERESLGARGWVALPPTLGAVLVGGFGTTVAMWCVWFVTHLPAVGVAASVSGPLLLLTFAFGMLVTGSAAGFRAAWAAGAGAGIVTALLSLMLLGSKVTEPAGATPGEGSAVVPGATVVILGFIVLALVFGTVFGGVGGLIAGRRRTLTGDHRLWLSRFGIVAVFAFAPLLVVGGAVTSTGSGMAVPDWPGTYGANMFMYPIALMADPRIFLEHTHRLFGALVGVTTLTMLLYTLASGPSRAAIGLAAGVFLLVCVQGVLGGLRVSENLRWLGMWHGVLAQAVFAGAVVLAIIVGPLYRTLGDGVFEETRRRARTAWLIGAWTLGLLFVQLTLGASYRHLGSPLAIGLHIALSIVIVLIACAMAFLCLAADRDTALGRTLWRSGAWVLGVVALQFGLGWVALMTGGSARRPVPQADELAAAPPIELWQAIGATAHQATGALLLALVMVAAVWARRISRG